MPEIITRSQWGARYGDGYGTAWPVADRLYLHHSDTIAPDEVMPYDDDYAAIRTIERIGMQRFGEVYGFPYTFGFTPAGLIFAGHNLKKNGAHTGGLNSRARGFVLVGNYMTRGMTAAQKTSIAWLIRHGHGLGWWSVLALTGGHRDVKATVCPGDVAYREISEVNRMVGSIVPPPPWTPQPTTPERWSWPSWMPRGHYFGLVTGPNASHGGYYSNERPFIRLIQQWLVYKGYVPGVTDFNSRWCDGIFERPTYDAVARFQRREMPGTQYYGQVWSDDWRKLVQS